MSITRDPNVPAEVAQLMTAFSRVADGSEAITVLNASIHMLSAAIGFVCKSNGLTMGDTEDYATNCFNCVMQSIRENWDRASSVSDIEVKPQ